VVPAAHDLACALAAETGDDLRLVLDPASLLDVPQTQLPTPVRAEAEDMVVRRAEQGEVAAAGYYTYLVRELPEGLEQARRGLRDFGHGVETLVPVEAIAIDIRLAIISGHDRDRVVVTDCHLRDVHLLVPGERRHARGFEFLGAAFPDAQLAELVRSEHNQVRFLKLWRHHVTGHLCRPRSVLRHVC
jgi:hypothetical protein